MIHIIEGNILNAPEDIIVHQVSCQGVMGAGLAKQIKEKYPEVYAEYRELFNRYQKNRKVLLGTAQFVTTHDGKTVVNVFGQYTYGRENKVYTDYNALSTGLKSVYHTITNEYSALKGKSIALPYGIGCGLAGGDWGKVYEIIDDIFNEYEVTLYKFG